MMDPNETLNKLRLAIQVVRAIEAEAAFSDGWFTDAQREALAFEAFTLADMAQALDQWLTRDGFPPEAWNHRRAA
jgi:hypothetical protein